MIVRPAGPGDKARLRKFCCETDGTQPSKLEFWIRRKALGWAAVDKHHYLRLLADGDDVIGLYAFMPGAVFTTLGEPINQDPDDDEDPVVHWFIRAVAIRSEFQGMQLGGRLLETCLEHVSEIEPYGGAYWKVEPNNGPSHSMSLRVGAEPSPNALPDRATEYFIYF